MRLHLVEVDQCQMGEAHPRERLGDDAPDTAEPDDAHAQAREIGVPIGTPHRYRAPEHLAERGSRREVICEVGSESPADDPHRARPCTVVESRTLTVPRACTPDAVGADRHPDEGEAGHRRTRARDLLLRNDVVRAHVLPPRAGVAVQEGDATPPLRGDRDDALEVGGIEMHVAVHLALARAREHHRVQECCVARGTRRGGPQCEREVFLAVRAEEVVAEFRVHVFGHGHAEFALTRHGRSCSPEPGARGWCALLSSRSCGSSSATRRQEGWRSRCGAQRRSRRGGAVALC